MKSFRLLQFWGGVAGLGVALAIVGCDSAEGDVHFPIPFTGDDIAAPSEPPPITSSRGPCPGLTAPSASATCDLTGINLGRWDGSCEYGHDLDARCNDVVMCTTPGWSFRAHASCYGRCPETFAGIVPGSPCSSTAVGCSYVEGTCACLAEPAGQDGGSGSGGRWRCAPPPGDGCPAQRPALKSDCVRPMKCDYGSCALRRDLSFQCLEQQWIQADSPFCQDP